MRIEELDYELPEDRIATQPAEPRDSARLMLVHRQSGRIEHLRVHDLPDLVRPAGVLRPGDLMVFNQTRVLPARFQATRVGTGGKVRGLYLRSPAPDRWEVMLESRGSLKSGERIALESESWFELLESLGGGVWLAQLHSPLDTLALLEQVGVMPIPPYIRSARKAHHQPELAPADAQRYNTVYAREPGSVAAPTAGLHFTPELLAALDRLGVARAVLTLHVGLGTFAPVRSQRVEDHPIHSEWAHIPPQTLDAIRKARTPASAARLIPVGTTSVRALESLPPGEPVLPQGYTAETRLFITPDTPGFTFRFADLLMTNFHLPRSTLMAMVAALPGVGIDNLQRWYAAAITEGYRFYSYGDAMLLA